MPHTQVQQSLILLMSGIFMIFLHYTNYVSHTGAAIPDPFDVRYLHDIPALYKLCLTHRCSNPWSFWCQVSSWYSCTVQTMSQRCNNPWSFWCRVSSWYCCIVQTMSHTQVQQSLILLMSSIFMMFLHCTNYVSHTGAAIPDPFDVRYLHDIPVLYKLCLTHRCSNPWSFWYQVSPWYSCIVQTMSHRCNSPWSFWCQVSPWYSCIVQTMSQRCNNPWSFWCQVSPWYSCIVQTISHRCNNPWSFWCRVSSWYSCTVQTMCHRCNNSWSFWCQVSSWYSCTVQTMSHRCNNPWSFWCQVSSWYSCIVQTMSHTQVQQSLILLMSSIFMIFLHCTNYVSHTGAAIPDPFDVRYLHDIPVLYKLCLTHRCSNPWSFWYQVSPWYSCIVQTMSHRCNSPWSFWCQVSPWYSCIVQTMSQRCNNPWSFWCQVSPWYSCIVQTISQVQQSLIP